MGRWDRFYEAKGQTGEQWLADEVVKTLVRDLAVWPPPVETWFDDGARARFEPVLAPSCPRPSSGVFRAAFQLARWELEREYDAIDEFVRNDRVSKITSDEREKLCLTFLHKWLTDSMLELLEASKLKRPMLKECLVRAEARLLAP
ncbi:hypothetical protein HY251_01210 [bacterium]|nr:hypothetical protein [bacterium]